MAEPAGAGNATGAAGAPGNAAGAAGPGRKTLLILAVDHRASLERDLYGLTAPPTPAEAARITADKLIVYQALLDAAARLPADVQPSVLIDEEYGASAAELAARSGGLIALCMPVEASGHDWFQFAYPGDWQRHAEFFSTQHAKVLVRDNPGLDAALRAEQARSLAEVSAWAERADRPLILELLVPAIDADKAATGGNPDRYDDELRPGLTLRVMEYLQDRGVSPAIWKVEGLDRREDAAAVAATAQRGGRSARCIVLGRHAPPAKLDRWLEVAAPLPGWIGFAIGRSIWWDALLANLHGECTAEQARQRVTQAYLDYATDYLKARDAAPAQQPAARHQ
jgi:myo-inositol catabolism protein IolC